MHKLTIEQQATVLNRHINGVAPSTIAQEFGVTKTVIHRILDSVDCRDLDDITKTSQRDGQVNPIPKVTSKSERKLVQLPLGDWW